MLSHFRIIGLFPLLLWTTFSYAQEKEFVVTADELTEAQNYKKKYPEESFVLKKLYTEYQFTVNTGTYNSDELVKCNTKEKREIVCLKEAEGIIYQDHVWFDNDSPVSDFKVTDPLDITYDKEEYATGDYKYQSEEIFHDDIRYFAYAINFRKFGQKLKFQYNQYFNKSIYIDPVYFTAGENIITREIKLIVPNEIEVEFVEKNFNKFKITKTVNKGANSTEITYKAYDVRAMKNEPSDLNFSYTEPHIIPVVKKYLSPGKDPVYLMNSLSDLYKWKINIVNSVENKPDSLKPIVNKIIEKYKTDDDIIRAIFYWIQENIKYIAFEQGIEGYKPDACQNVLNKKYGDCKGMANLLKHMLKIARYDARVTWVGTDELAYNFELPSLYMTNHMICTLVMGDKNNTIYFLDPTVDYISLGDISEHVQGKNVMIENGRGYMFVKIPELPNSRNKEFLSQTIKIDNDKLVGKITETYNGQSKIYVKAGLSETQQHYKELLIKNIVSNNNKNIVIKKIEYNDISNKDSNLTFSYDYEILNAVSDFGNKKYISIDIHEDFKKMIFDSTRTKEYFFPYKKYIEKTSRLEIPTDYTLTRLPENFSYSDDKVTVSVSYELVNNEIIYKKTIALNTRIIPTEYFETWNKCFKSLKDRYNDAVVLTKK